MYLMYNMTCEGVGAQYQRIIALLGIAKIHNLKFLHKMITVGHNYNNDPSWNEKWDTLFNIKTLTEEQYPPNHEIIYSKRLTMQDLKTIVNTENRIFSISLPFDIVDRVPNIYYKIVQDDIRRLYQESNKNRTLHLFKKNRTNIAIHIRVINHHDDQCEIKDFENLEGRYEIHDYQYIMLISKLQKLYPRADVHIFSQPNIYKKYKSLTKMDGVQVHINTDAIDTFHHFCSADILVISKSSFSYLAGIYNKNKVLYIPFHHPPLEEWESIRNYIK